MIIQPDIITAIRAPTIPPSSPGDTPFEDAGVDVVDANEECEILASDVLDVAPVVYIDMLASTQQSKYRRPSRVRSHPHCTIDKVGFGILYSPVSRH
jgi:hypothetical protein